MADCPSPLRLVPGPRGRAGEDGTDGTDGVSSFTTLTAGFTMPAISATANATVADSAWAVIGEPLHLQSAGTLIVTAIPDATTLTLQNPSGYPANVAAGTVIPPASKLGPSGFIGPAGAGGSSGSGVTVSTKGDLQGHNATVPASLSVGANGTLPHADSTAALGIAYRGVDLSGAATTLSGDLQVTEGGTGSSTAAGAATNLSVLPLSGGTLTGPLVVSHTTPEYRLTEAGATADEGHWSFRADGDVLKLQAVNDAEAVRVDWLSVNRTGTVVDSVVIAATIVQVSNLAHTSNTYFANTAVALSNGANNNVNMDGGTWTRITGPTAAFSITGITNGGTGALGRMLLLHNSTAFDMTLANESASSTALNRILTGTGADVTLTAASRAWLMYDVTDSRWILMGTQG